MNLKGKANKIREETKSHPLYINELSDLSEELVHGSHVVKTICKLDEHNTWIINHA